MTIEISGNYVRCARGVAQELFQFAKRVIIIRTWLNIYGTEVNLESAFVLELYETEVGVGVFRHAKAAVCIIFDENGRFYRWSSAKLMDFIARNRFHNIEVCCVGFGNKYNVTVRVGKINDEFLKCVFTVVQINLSAI